MTPFHFGSGRRRLFGMYMPVGGPVSGARAALLCAPALRDYVLAHRSLRQLASQMAAAGFHVLRFDYHGTGDSDGDMTDADLTGWQDDIATAVEELQDMTGARRVALIGLRLGATLAAQASVRLRKQVESLVLWDPVVRGDEYLQELTAPPEQPRPRPAERGGGFELQGFPVNEALLNQLRAVDLTTVAPQLGERLLVVCSRAQDSHAELRAALPARGAGAPAYELIESQPAWLEDPTLGAGAIPVRVLQRIVEWHRK